MEVVFVQFYFLDFGRIEPRKEFNSKKIFSIFKDLNDLEVRKYSENDLSGFKIFKIGSENRKLLQLSHSFDEKRIFSPVFLLLIYEQSKAFLWCGYLMLKFVFKLMNKSNVSGSFE